ncbi:glycosyltransferase family 4 protein [Streptomyces sp. NPDC059698]|uniref:glycosyltransferase family 4 protein n=1 Tax=unclassified Streptomyces TaxID=2593676 RepID=UPI00093FAA4C|nr:glycosyltransferase family 4 protein [Streptomyces sp. CB02366]OKJ39303.1 glycosyl transferase family 1 [Streptomyces sp. CB02366]WSS55453.1 glycosyltransferase family 4 protein [Streptomyces sp. NBC_01178]
MEPDSTTRHKSRGRVVMLVDNGVKGDSRVQKAARSAADAGWDVVLFGVSPNSEKHSWKIGDAEVRLIPKPNPLRPRRHDLRRPFPRRPLAYRSPQVARYRVQAVKAWRSDLSFRQAAAKAAAAGHPGRSASGSKGRLLVPRVSSRIYGKWVALRARETTNLQERRSMLDAPLDRCATALWQKLMGQRSWRRLMPNLWDFELAFAKHIDALKPDLIHAHDFKMLGVGARAAVRARAAGRPVKLVWDAHEYVPGLPPRHGRWLPAHVAWEKEHAVFADAVVTVSPALAELLKEGHQLTELPTVVLNAPVISPGADEVAGADPVPDLRELCGVGPDTPLLAYVGGINPVRGVETIIEGLTRMPDVHVAMVSVPPGKPYAATATIRKLVAELGVGDRVHFLPFVPHWQVAEFVAPADAAVSPLHHLANHELALSNKFFEYSQARLPQVVSDIRTMSEMVRSTGQGEVFRAQDTEDYVRAVKAVLADPERYRAAYDTPGLLEKWTWEAQAEILDGIYSRLLPDRARVPAASSEPKADARA